jgi:hypothetical protein
VLRETAPGAQAVVTGRPPMRLRNLLTTGALVMGALALTACGETTPSNVRSTEFVTSGDCPAEQEVALRALARSGLRVDVDGDGRLDKVAVASRPQADPPCRAIVAVRVRGGSTYSTHLFQKAVPMEGLPARVIGLLDLGDVPGAQIVVDTRAAVDAVLAQMLTLADGRLHVVEMPDSDDGTFIVGGGGVIYPHAAACTADGRMVLSRAAQTPDGERYRVVRRTYAAQGTPLQLVDPETKRRAVPVDELVTAFPEFGPRHWTECAAPALRPSKPAERASGSGLGGGRV